jgi:hypothetical protein
MISSALVGVALAGCDAPSDRAAAPSGIERTNPNAVSPAQALADALGDPDAYARARRLGALLPTLGPEATSAVKQTLESFRLDLGAVEFELMLRFWASHEPAEATAWTFKHAPPLFRIAGGRTAIAIWAEADPAAALVAAESALAESSEDVARAVQLAMVQGWFRTDRPGLEQYIYDLGSGMKRQRSLYAYLLALAAADGSAAATAWAGAVSEEDARYKLEVYRQLMVALTWADVPGAMRFCEEHCDGPYGKGMRNVLIRTRLRNGDYGGDIVEWVASVPDGDEEQRNNKRHSLWVAYITWAYRDRDPALAWMAERAAVDDPEPWVRFLFAEYARQIAAESPAEAIPWAERVEDDNDRERSLVRIARAWLLKDPEAAEAWISQSSLSERARDQARNTKLPTYLHQLPSD